MSSLQLKSLHAPLAEEFRTFEQRFEEALQQEEEIVGKLIQHASQFQGKRLRPLLLLTSARACGEIRPVHYELAIVVELIHNATLIHDDILDDATLRRRVSTLNTAWGDELSVLFGDYLFARAFTICSRLDVPEAVQILSETAHEMCVGELRQTATRFNFSMPRELYIEIIRRKTASLFDAACRLGASCAGAEDRHVRALSRFGLLLGIAFQIVDDYLDILGEEKIIGKSLGTDLAKGKMTMPLIELFEVLPQKEARRLEALLREGQLPDARQAIRELMQRFQVEHRALDRAEEFLDRALPYLEKLPPSPYRNHLATLARFSIRREL